MTTPYNSYLRVADSIRTAIVSRTYTTRLPTRTELGRIHGVGRGVITRALNKLYEEGLAEHVPGTGWYVAHAVDSRPMDVRLRELLIKGDFSPGSRFPSERQLCAQFDTLSNQAIRNGISRLIGEGLVSEVEGRCRYVLAIPADKERPWPGSLMNRMEEN